MRHFWVFVNPISGTGHSLKVWNEAAVLFDKAGIVYDLVGELKLIVFKNIVNYYSNY